MCNYRTISWKPVFNNAYRFQRAVAPTHINAIAINTITLAYLNTSFNRHIKLRFPTRSFKGKSGYSGYRNVKIRRIPVKAC